MRVRLDCWCGCFASVGPVLGRKVEEGHEFVALFLQAQCNLGIFGFVGFDEEIESLIGIVLGLGLPNIVQGRFGFRLRKLGQAIEHIHRFVHPAALLARLRVNFIQRGPEAHSTISYGQFGCIHSAFFESEKNFPPALCGLAHPIIDGQKLLLSTGVYANNDKGTQLVVLTAQAAVDAVRTDIDP